MTVLGVDPGLATVGFGVISSQNGRQSLVACGVITTPAGEAFSSRLERVFDDMSELIAAFAPDSIAVEELFFNTNITTGIAVAQARGVIMLACRKSGKATYEYTPLQVKQAVAGYGRADKKQVMDMIKRLLRLDSAPRPDDAADALAIALCHARSSTSLLREMGGGL